MRKAFTMIELIFVIVIIGILAAVALPKLAATRDDAKITSVIAAARTAYGDLASYYTSQGNKNWRSAKVNDVTNVNFSTDCAQMDPTAVDLSPNANLSLCAEDGSGVQEVCVNFETVDEGNVSITLPAASGTICKAVQQDVAIVAMSGITKLGGDSVNR